MKTVIIQRVYALPVIPKTLEEVPEEKLEHHLVTICHKYGIKTPVSLIQEFYKPTSLFLKTISPLDSNKLKDLIIEWDVFSPTLCLLLQTHVPSLN